MSTHEVKVVEIKNILPHPNADQIEIVPVWGYNCITKKGSFQVGQLAAYIEPDYMVPTTRDEFNWLSGNSEGFARIKAKRLRGIWSQGLLIPAPAGSSEGDDVMGQLGVLRYNPPEVVSRPGMKHEPLWSEEGPAIPHVKYDLENFRKYANMLPLETEVSITEKIHGANARYCFTNGRMYAGSRTQWRRSPGTYEHADGRAIDVPDCEWWRAIAQYPEIREWCENNPDHVLYGEIFGPGIQGKDFSYGLADGQVGFKAFDVLKHGFWLPVPEFKALVPESLRVPNVTSAHLGDIKDKLAELAEKPSFAGGLREGIVIKPMVEMYSPLIGRMALKFVSDSYLAKD